MNRSLKWMLSIVAVAALAVPALAQNPPAGGPRQGGGPGGPGMGRGMGMGRMDEKQRAEYTKKVAAAKAKIYSELKLNAAQIKAMKAADTKEEAEMKKLRDAFMKTMKPGERPDQKTMDANRKKLEAVHKAHEASIVKAIGAAKAKTYNKRLGEEMQKIFKAMFPNAQQGGPRAGGGGPRAGGGGAPKTGGGN